MDTSPVDSSMDKSADLKKMQKEICISEQDESCSLCDTTNQDIMLPETIKADLKPALKKKNRRSSTSYSTERSTKIRNILMSKVKDKFPHMNDSMKIYLSGIK